MERYELKELKVLLQVMIDRKKISTADKDLYYKVVEDLGENKFYEHIAQVMIDKGWLKRLDKDMYLCHNEEGKRCYSFDPYYMLTDKGLKEFRRKVRRYNRPKVRWEIVVSLLGIVVTILLQRCAGGYV